jgi:hypothetical protein
MRKFLSCLGAVALALTALIALPASASANNDPHRVYFGSTPFDLGAEYCGFPVHVDFPVNNEYATETDLPDGTMLFKVTGGQLLIITNTVTHASTKVNASGPGTFAFYPDGTASILLGRGVGVLYAKNLKALGYPSNIIQVSNVGGPVTLDPTTMTFTELPSSLHVLRDICADLS